MLLPNKISFATIFVLIFLLKHHVSRINAASCKSSIIFHWRETGEKRQTEKKNWNKLDKELGGSKIKLSSVLNPTTTFGFTLVDAPGRDPCCWEAYPEEKFKGKPVRLISRLPNGFGGIPGFPRFQANSLKKIPCEE